MGLSHTVSGDIASFRTPSRVPIESLKFHFLPKQEGSGDPSPTNIRPITGWTGLNGRRARKNLLKFNKNWVSNPFTSNGITFTVHYKQDGSFDYINVKGARTAPNVFYNLNYFGATTAMKPGHYVVSGYITGVVGIRAYEYNPTDTLILNTETGVDDFYAHEGATASWLRLQINTTEYIDVDIYPMLMAYPCSDTEYETYSEEQIPITFPVAGTNKLDPSIILNNHGHFSLNNGIWSNAVTDERTYIQLAVQLWKSTGTYIKTLYVDYVKTTGRHVLTFTVDDPNGHYICLKHNGTKKDFILLFPWTFGLHQYTISLDVLSADPTTVGGVQLTNIQLEPGDTAHAYEPYSSENTLLGGYIDPVKGEIWKEYEEIVFDGSDADAFTYVNTSDSSGISRHYFNTKVLDRIVKSNSTSIAYSDSATPTSNSFDHRTTICYYIGTPTNQVSLNIAATECDPTAESFNSYLQNHPVHLVYKLATPVLVATFDPITLQALLDHNNFWSDTNDITEVTYAVTESKDILDARKLIMDGSQPRLEDASGTIASFSTDMKAPVKELKAYFTPVQEGSGDASPQNERPIHGWTRCFVGHDAENKLSPTPQTTTNLGVTWTVDNYGNISFEGTPTSWSNVILGYVDIEGITQLYGHIYGDIDNVCFNTLALCDSSKNVVATIATGWEEYRQPSINISQYENAKYARIGIKRKENNKYMRGSVYVTVGQSNNDVIIPVEFQAAKNLVALNRSPARNQDKTAYVTIAKQTPNELEFTTGGTTTWECVRLFYTFPAGTYTAQIKGEVISGESEGYNPLVSFYKFGDSTPFTAMYANAKTTFTINEETIFDIRIFGNNSTPVQRTLRYYDFQVEQGSTATVYEPYGTVYGGYVDLIRGKIIADHIHKAFTWGDIKSSRHTSSMTQGVYTFDVPVYTTTGSYYIANKALCNIAKFAWEDMVNYPHFYIDFNNSGGKYNAYIILPNETSDDLHIEIVTKLVTPIEYDLTPQQLKTLKGTNNIWSNANGNIEVKYWTH